MTDRHAIIVTGDILNGLEFTGPFDDYRHRRRVHRGQRRRSTWIVADHLQAPSTASRLQNPSPG
jgi:hypothetical protein